VKLENLIVIVANLSKTLHINFYQNRSSIVEVMIKKFGVKFGVFFMPHSVGWTSSRLITRIIS